MTRKIVVTGGEGFIGSNLIERLVAKGFEVHSVDNTVRPHMRIQGANYHTEDILDFSALKQLFARADVVFHMAALPSVQDSIDRPIETAETNIMGTQYVFEAAHLAGVRRVVFSSSSAIYGDQGGPHQEDMKPSPLSPYAAHKLAGETLAAMYSKTFGLETVSLRYFNVYGPRLDPSGPYSAVIGLFLQKVREGKPITILGDGLQTRDFVHVSDVVSANLAAADRLNIGGGEVFNIGTGCPVAINALAALIGGSECPVEHLSGRKEIRHSVADISRAEEVLLWNPDVSIQAGISHLKRGWGLM
jgi:nucleoside-diphosphate-sugar epimerase